MAVLTNEYQYIGRSNAVGCAQGYEYYILIYAKTLSNAATGKHTVTVKMTLACDAQSSFYGFRTTGSAVVNGSSAFAWERQNIPNSAWTFNDVTIGGYKYRAWIDLIEGSVEVDVGFGSAKDISISSSWVMKSSYSENWFPYTDQYATTSHTVTLPMIAGVLYIDNGSGWSAYEAYVDNGKSWDKVIPYIDNGKSWDICT